MHTKATLFERVSAPDSGVLERLDADTLSQRIVTGAFDEIATHGWQRMTMHNVAKRSGLGRATVYRRFPSKDDLLEAVVLSEMRKYLAANAVARVGLSHEQDRIAESAAFAVEYLRAHPLLNRMLETEPETLVPSLTSSALIGFAREFIAGMWRQEIHGDEPITAERAQHLKAVAEIHVRLTLSFLVSQDSAIPLATGEDARTFARRYLAPLLTA
ncbi:helix-turn-helix domain-containing protein [Rhodococcus sp. G-MC3]|uniref:TetR/AcrR family transcriptional regulator n=1 Tax=Rhodococcus sp. G-MC3 TaxID=3046209 RepID=UPI0024BA5602|nr:helix-turn-helix domain-containing protein [Rhodococcus sp. G-MC3]MDJ0396635.1 helix-turn-helix domain-containing protein [Rhodococcus sp. G-MC3]